MCLCVCPCACVHPEVIREITCNLFKQGSHNLDQVYKTPAFTGLYTTTRLNTKVISYSLQCFVRKFLLFQKLDNTSLRDGGTRLHWGMGTLTYTIQETYTGYQNLIAYSKRLGHSPAFEEALASICVFVFVCVWWWWWWWWCVCVCVCVLSFWAMPDMTANGILACMACTFMFNWDHLFLSREVGVISGVTKLTPGTSLYIYAIDPKLLNIMFVHCALHFSVMTL